VLATHSGMRLLKPNDRIVLGKSRTKQGCYSSVNKKPIWLKINVTEMRNKVTAPERLSKALRSTRLVV
jgi:hypothetical protein